LGLQVLAWTVNSPGDITQMIDIGVDGIVSDRPDLVREQMRRLGLPLPAANTDATLSGTSRSHGTP
jgi:glycerophosphoryl diester phosphodiesterase